MTRSTAIWFVAVLIGVCGASDRIGAHKPVTSKYTYNQDVLPIFREKCAACHRSDGVAPMSLMTYEEAFPWAESIRAELIAARMPPASADPTFGAVQHNQFLTARETDIILTWATGGNPRGAEVPPAAASPDKPWSLGAPDAVLKLPDTTLAAGQSEDTREFVVKPPAGAQWLRAVDVRPGTASVVRNVVVSLKATGQPTGPLSPEQVICRWIPGQAPVDISTEGVGFFLPSGAELVARVHYKKTYLYDGKSLTDSTALGLYFAKSAPKKLEALPLNSPQPVAPGAGESYTVDVPQDVDAIGLRVDTVPPDVSIEIEGLPATGSALPLVRFAARPSWEQRYWFARPVALPRGSRVQIRVVYRDPAFVADAFGGVNASAAEARPTPVRLALDVAAH